MKDSEFIELLNLYLDHEISAADAARLEAEVQSNPARRRVYREYCQMQKACKLLVHDLQTEVAPAGDKKVVAFDSGVSVSHRREIFAAGAFVALAACVTIIFVSRSREAGAAGSVAQSALVARELRTVPTAVAPVAAPVAEVSPRMIAQTVSVPARRDPAPFVANARSGAGEIDSHAMLTTSGTPGNSQFEWMRTVQLAPLPQRVPLEDLRFEARPVNLRPDGRALGTRPVAPGDAEMSAFRFIK